MHSIKHWILEFFFQIRNKNNCFNLETKLYFYGKNFFCLYARVLVLLLVVFLVQSCTSINSFQRNELHASNKLYEEAKFFFQQGKKEEAIKLIKRALVDREDILGLEHPITIQTRRDLAFLREDHTLVEQLEKELTESITKKMLLNQVGYKFISEKEGVIDYLPLHTSFNYAESTLLQNIDDNNKKFGTNHLSIVINTVFLADFYQHRGLFDKAENLLQDSLSILENEPTANRAYKSSVIRRLADLYRTTGRLVEAEVLYSKTIRIYETELDIEYDLSNFLGLATAKKGLAILYFNLGQLKEAESLSQDTLIAVKKIMGPKHSLTADFMEVLGSIFYAQENYNKAEKLYTSVLELREKIHGPENLYNASILTLLGILFHSQGRNTEAEEFHKDALKIWERKMGSEHFGNAVYLNNLAETYREQEKYHEAELYYFRALSLLVKTFETNHPDIATVLLNYASLHYDQNNTGNAIFFGKLGLNILQASRVSIQQLSDELRKSFLKSKESSYRTVADWLLEAGRLAEAEQVLAMLKEEEHYQYLRRSQSATKTLNTRIVCTRWEEEHCQHYQKLSNNLREAGKALLETEKQARAGAEVEQKRLSELQQRLKTRKSAFDKGLAQINSTLSAWQGNPEYKLHVEKDVLQRSNRLRRSLKELGHGAVSLHYLLMEDGVRIILTTPDKQLTRNSEIKLVTLRRKVGAMRQALLRQQEQVDYKALSQELYALLIFPVADELAAANAQTLMVSLDGILRYLPFAALYDGQQFLIERYAVNFQTLAARTDLNIRPQPNWQISGFGVSQAADVVDPVTLKPINFVSLPFVATELKTLIRQNDKEAGLLPGEIYLDEAFSKQKLTQVLTREQPSPVIHIGSHFELRPGDNSRSFLLLGQNTILTMAEVYDENLDFSGADLVTLSACDTAMGEDNALSNGAEIESFGVLVQELGAKSVMATLWPVIDESTSFFMKRFYQLREQNNLTKAEALRQAQLSMITSGDKFSQPYYWAPFVLMGNWL